MSPQKNFMSSLLPAFDDLDATATWVSSTASQHPKPVFDMADFSAFNVDSAFPSVGDSDLEKLFDFKFPSPVLAETQGLDTGLGSFTAVPPSSTLPSGPAFIPSNLPAADNMTFNALQLDMFDSFTPSGSPLAASSGYTSPAFEFSPTPALTMCPTVDSTPGARSNSRSSSRSSFSAQTEDVKPVLSRVPSTASTASSIIGPDGKPKKQHLCPYVDCARHHRTFRSNADLQRHIRSHRGERPHACPSPGCGKAYGQHNKMVNHVKQQHPALLPYVEVGRSRRRTTTSAPVSTASSRANSVPRTSSAASTPAPHAASHTPTSVGPTRTATTQAPRAAPYSIPDPASTAAARLAYTLGATRGDNGVSLTAHARLRNEVFGHPMWS